jgi:phospholipid transport system substrate-binding protein
MPNSRSIALAVLMLVAMLLPRVAAQAQEAPATYMQRVANELVAASRSGSAAPSMFAATIRRHADVPTLGTYALGTYARGLAHTDRTSYYNGMVGFIARYAAKESPKYPVATAIVVGQTEETKDGVYVDSRVTLKSGETYDVRWWLVRRPGGYKVRDAQAVGFWMSPFLKSLFENYISENGGNPKALVFALNR